MASIVPLDLSQRPIVEAYLKRYPPQVSELTFTNLYVWRDSRPVLFVESGDAITFLVNTAQGKNGDSKVVFGSPIGGVSLTALVPTLDVQVSGFVRITEDTARELHKSGLHVETDRDNADYVYRVSELAALEGRRYHKKRNLIKQCLKEHTCEYEAVTAEVISACLAMQDRWCEARQCGQDPGLCSEYVAIRHAFAHFEELGLIGSAIRVDGTIEAYALGEALRPDTAVCHFEKAMPGFRGLGQLINQWFAKFSLEGFEFVNREQDLGIPGLRQAKESYYPDHMVDKFNAWYGADSTQKPKPVEPHECHKHGVEEE